MFGPRLPFVSSKSVSDMGNARPPWGPEFAALPPPGPTYTAPTLPRPHVRHFWLAPWVSLAALCSHILYSFASSSRSPELIFQPQTTRHSLQEGFPDYPFLLLQLGVPPLEAAHWPLLSLATGVLAVGRREGKVRGCFSSQRPQVLASLGVVQPG